MFTYNYKKLFIQNSICTSMRINIFEFHLYNIDQLQL